MTATGHRRIACLGSLVLIAAALVLVAPPLARGVPPVGRTWRYRDLADSAPKHEGGYVEPSSEVTRTSPHGGFDTATNKCAACHASHRSTGTSYLTRADQLSDTCEYCHLGSSHSSTSVYEANERGVDTTVGHRMGLAASIPASTRGFRSLDTTELAVADAAGQVATYTVDIRSVEASPNALFRLDRGHTHLPAGAGRSGYSRVGPMPLTCTSCHVVHGSAEELWQPAAFPDNTASAGAGYKLLRRNPSGSVYGPDDAPYGGGGPPTVSYTRDGMIEQRSYTDFRTTGLVDATATIEAPETTLTAGSGFGSGKTVWDSAPFRTPDQGGGGSASDPSVAKAGVNQYALSAWCADCHNLAIGEHGGQPYAEMAAHESSRTHTSPMVSAGNGPGQCYSCHRADLTPRPLTAAYDEDAAAWCEGCHYGTGSYAVDPARLAGGSDFPHSAESSSAYMLGAWTVDDAGEVVTATVTPGNARELVCKRCHRSGQGPHEHISSVGTDTISGTLLDAGGVAYTYEPPNGSITATYSELQCASCHRMDVREEHAKPSSEGSGSRCLTCHPQPRDSFETWDRTCAQAGCHTVSHDAMSAKHAQSDPPASRATCGSEAACHDEWDGWDVAMVHANAWYQWSSGQWADVTPTRPLPAFGCALCHDDASVTPAEKDCAVCHPARPAGHPSVEASGGAGG